MVRSRLQHHVCLGDSIDERACIDLLRARRVVVSVETGEAIKHCFLCGISGDGKGHGSPSRLLSPECVPVKDQRLINFAVITALSRSASPPAVVGIVALIFWLWPPRRA